MKTLLPAFLQHVSSSSSSKNENDDCCTLVDLGCGTGRNTLALHRAAPSTRIIGLEPSSKMLDIARQRITAQNVLFEHFDIPISTDASTAASITMPKNLSQGADGLISTLVLEHVPLSAFFHAAAALLRPGGVFLLTNMHSDMGGISQAGFVHPVTKIKIRPTSYAHTIPDVLNAAREAGFEVLGDEGMKEVAVTEDMVESLGPRGRKWVGVQCWFGGCLRKVA